MESSKFIPRDLSFAPGDFVKAVRQGRNGKVDKMIDELILNGHCVLDWIQANVEGSNLGYHPTKRSIISQVPAIEDDEPNRHLYGMSFSCKYLCDTIFAAGEELLQYTPHEEHVLDRIPGSRSDSQAIRQLAILLDEFVARGLTANEYMDHISVTVELRFSPLFIAMFDVQDGAIILRNAIRKDGIAGLMFTLLRIFDESQEPGTTVH